jgi:hypothetical protein
MSSHEDIQMLSYAVQKRPARIEKHYTPPALARRLVSMVPIKRGEVVLDPSSGKNKTFFDAFPFRRYARECDIEDGVDFLTTPLAYAWAVTNPPYHLLWAFIDKVTQEASRGFAFLVNINGINTLTPKRLELLRQRGFHMRHLHVCNVKEWMGRYYFYIFMRERGPVNHTWDTQTWRLES